MITTLSGIKMPVQKKSLLQLRLQKRMKALNISSYDEYCRYLFSSQGKKFETAKLLSVVSTNKTEFFREKAHFDFLLNTLLKKLCSSHNNSISIWSAGCATGEEVYSIAMTCEEFIRLSGKNLDYRILGTDISEHAILTAKLAIYKAEKAVPVPPDYKKRYLLKSRENQKDLIRVAPQLRQKTKFALVNLVDISMPASYKFDVVFCRNTLIYFNQETQKRTIDNILSYIKKGGYLFIGHSESLFHLGTNIKAVQPTIYQTPE